MIMQVMINLPQIFIWPIRPHNQPCQASMLRMSEKFVEPPQKYFKRCEENFVGPTKILKIMYPRLAKIAFHGISAVKLSVI